MRSRRLALTVALVPLSLGVFFACGDDDSTSKKSGGDASVDVNEGSVGEGSSDDAAADATDFGDPCGDITGLQGGAAWPMAGGCPKRGGISLVAGPTNTAIRFRAEIPVNGASPVIDVGGTLYIATTDGRLVTVNVAGGVADAGAVTIDAGSDAASDADTSDAGLSVADASTLTGTSPALGSGGQIIYGESDNNAYAWSYTPALEWQHALGATPLASPAISAASNVYITTNAGALVALSLATGAQVWSAQTHDTFGTSAPAIGDDQSVYVGSSDKHLYAFTKDGAARFQFATDSAVSATPSVARDGTVIIADIGGAVYAIDPSSGKEKWRAAAGASVSHGCAIGLDLAVFCGSDDGKVHAFDAAGKLRWVYTTNGAVTAPIVDTNGIVYVGSEDTHLYAIAQSGKLLYAVSVFGPVHAQPAMGADGAIYVTTDTELVGIGP